MGGQDHTPPPFGPRDTMPYPAKSWNPAVLSMARSRSSQDSSLRLSLHSALSYAFATAAVSRLCVGCLTGRPPSRTARLGLGVLTASVPLTALPQSLRAPLRWRGVFITSLFTALFVSTALATLDDEGRFTGRWVYIAWAASALQFGHRCARYHLEVEDAERCAGEQGGKPTPDVG